MSLDSGSTVGVEAGEQRGAKGEVRWLKFLLALPSLFYLAFPTRNFYWDGVAFAIDIEKQTAPSSLLHPNHLIYTMWGSWLYRFSEALGLHVRALFVLQTANAVLAGLAVIVFFRCLRLLSVPQNLSIAASLLLGFSATWWRFASDANAYIPSIFLLLCVYAWIGRSRRVVAGLVHACAILFHQLAILFLPVAVIRLRKSRRSLTIYWMAALVPTVAAYLFAYNAVAEHPTLTGLLTWATYHSPDSGFSFNALESALFSARGTLRLLFGGKAGDLVGDGVSNVALGTMAVSAMALLANLPQVWKAPNLSTPSRHLFVWAGAYVAFLFFWMPQNTFYRLYYLPPLIAVLVTMLRRAPSTRTACWLFVATVWAWNFAFLIYPQSHARWNVPLSFALQQKPNWPAGTPIVFHRFHPDLWTISYFNRQASWIELGSGGLEQLERNLAYARTQQQPLWLEATAYDFIAATANGQAWLAAHERPLERVLFTDDRHEFRFHCLR